MPMHHHLFDVASEKTARLLERPFVSENYALIAASAVYACAHLVATLALDASTLAHPYVEWALVSLLGLLTFGEVARRCAAATASGDQSRHRCHRSEGSVALLVPQLVAWYVAAVEAVVWRAHWMHHDTMTEDVLSGGVRSMLAALLYVFALLLGVPSLLRPRIAAPIAALALVLRLGPPLPPPSDALALGRSAALDLVCGLACVLGARKAAERQEDGGGGGIARVNGASIAFSAAAQSFWIGSVASPYALLAGVVLQLGIVLCYVLEVWERTPATPAPLLPLHSRRGEKLSDHDGARAEAATHSDVARRKRHAARRRARDLARAAELSGSRTHSSHRSATTATTTRHRAKRGQPVASHHARADFDMYSDNDDDDNDIDAGCDSDGCGDDDYGSAILSGGDDDNDDGNDYGRNGSGNNSNSSLDGASHAAASSSHPRAHARRAAPASPAQSPPSSSISVPYAGHSASASSDHGRRTSLDHATAAAAMPQSTHSQHATTRLDVRDVPPPFMAQPATMARPAQATQFVVPPLRVPAGPTLAKTDAPAINSRNAPIYGATDAHASAPNGAAFPSAGPGPSRATTSTSFSLDRLASVRLVAPPMRTGARPAAFSAPAPAQAAALAPVPARRTLSPTKVASAGDAASMGAGAASGGGAAPPP